ncbi:unnamed protein product [Notodromas monacha]|uniref:Secreted protein n=1 Tax=Notodromas monacha TaxID=399045 RepID=A0A7R9GBW0_9CRUS|nr:unnamed protein product [Notodromas monacha]CAG0915382.1 unnamed protein product [Notodromas monacha]
MLSLLLSVAALITLVCFRVSTLYKRICARDSLLRSNSRRRRCCRHPEKRVSMRVMEQPVKPCASSNTSTADNTEQTAGGAEAVERVPKQRGSEQRDMLRG